MAKYNPFEKKDDNTNNDKNWFMKTAIKVAAGTGTAFGVYGLWKIKGPAGRILEDIVNKDMRQKIAREQYDNIDKNISDLAKGWNASQKSLRDDTWGEDINPFRDTETTAISSLATPTSTRNNIARLESNIMSNLEIEASYFSPEAQIQKVPIGGSSPGNSWHPLNREKTKWIRAERRLAGTEDIQLARVRQLAISKYLEMYMATSVETDVPKIISEITEFSEFFSSDGYLNSNEISEYGKGATRRINEIHEAYMSDKHFADIYQQELKKLDRRFRLFSHSNKRHRPTREQRLTSGGGGYRQALYGNVTGGIDLGTVATVTSTSTPFDPNTQVTSKGLASFTRFSKLQETNYTGKIFNLQKALENAEREGNLGSHSISIIDYGTGYRTDKRLLISLTPVGSKKNYDIEIPIGIDGRIGGATPGLQQYVEQFHIVGNVYGYADDALHIINTTEMNLLDVEKAFNGSLFTGWDSFKDHPDKFIRQVNRMIRQNIQQNAAATDSIYDLYRAMSIDIPSIRDLTSSSRPRYASARRTAANFVSSARAIKKIVQRKKTGKKTIVINLDIETLDNTSASPGTAILSKNAQVTKYGILVQDVQTGVVKETIERSNMSGYHHLLNKDHKKQGSGFNTRVRKWLRDSVLPQGTSAGHEVEAYHDLLMAEGADNITDRKQVINQITNTVRSLRNHYEKEGYDVYIATKNGSNFDLRAINMDDPSFIKQFKGKLIDIQAIDAFRNNALGQNNALNIERVIQRLTGKIGEQGVEYSTNTVAGIRNLMHLFHNRGLLRYDLQKPFWEVHGKQGVMTAHASPRVDAAFVAAILMKDVADYTASSNFLDSADYIASLLKKTSGGKRPEDLTELFRLINDKVIQGYGVASFRSSSSGMISNLIAGFIEPSEMSAFADPYNIGIRRRHAMPFTLRLRRSYINRQYGGSASPNVYKKHLGHFFTTNTIEEASSAILNYVHGAGDDAKQYSNAILADTLYSLDMEREPTVAISEGLARKYEQVKIVNLQTEGIANDSTINNKIYQFSQLVKKRAAELANGGDITPNIIKMAELEIAGRGDWSIDFSSEILSSGKYGGEVKLRKKSLYGKIVSVLMETPKVAQGKTSLPRFLVKIEETTSGRDVFFGAQAQTIGTHGLIGSINTVSETVASRMLGIGSEFIMANSPDFLKKGHIGSAKDIMLSGLIKKLYNDYETAGVRDKPRIKRLINKISRELKAKPDITNNRLIFNKRNIAGATDLRTRILGSNDVRLKQIISWYKQAGLVWNQREMNEMADAGFNFQQQFKPYLDYFQKITKLSDEQLRAAHAGFDGLTKEGIDAVREDLAAFEGLMYDNVHNTRGSAKIFRVVPQIDKGFTLGILGYGPMALYRQDTKGLVNRDVVMRQDYFLGLRHTYHGKDKTTLDFVARHTFASRYDTYKSVKRTYNSFCDTIFATELTKGAMDIKKIAYLVDIEQRIALKTQESRLAGRETWSDMSSGELVSALTDRNALEDKLSELTPEARTTLMQEKTAIADALNGKKDGPRLLEYASGRKRFYTTKDVNMLSRLAKENNGVLCFNLPVSNNALEIDLDKTFERFNGQMPGRPKLSQKGVSKAMNELKYILKQKLANAKKDSPLRFNEKGKLEMGALIIDMDPMSINEFSPDSSIGSWRSSRTTETKLRLLRALHEWQAIVDKSTHNPQSTDVMSAQDHFVRAWAEFVLTGLDANKDTKFWKSGQFAPPSIKTYAADLTQLQKAAIQLEESKPNSFKKYGIQFKLLKDARLDTIIISEEAYRKFQFVNQDGEKINAARYIEEHYKEKGSTQGKEIAKGRRLLPGGLVERFPLSQAGNHGMNTVNYLVMSSNALKKLGADPNAVYANPVYWGTQGGDFDGDIMFLHLKELGIYNTYDELKQANEQSYINMMETKHMQETLRSNQIKLDGDGNPTKPVKIGNLNTILFRSGDSSFIQTYDVKGNVKRMWIKSDKLDITDRVTHLSNLIQGLSSSGSGFVTESRIAQYAESQVNTLISKEIIPVTTNLIKKRVKEILADADLRQDPLRVQSFTGNTLHAIAGLGQSVIDLAKHPEEAAKLSKILNFLTSGQSTNDSKNLWLELEKKAFGSLYDRIEAEANYDILAGRLTAIGKLKQRSANFAMQNTIDDMMYMGKPGTTILHAAQAWADTFFDDLISPEKPKSIMDEINESFSRKLGKQIDLGPIMKKTGKYGAIGASIFLGLSLFTPFGNSKSLNPLDMFVDIGDIDGQRAAVSSPLELPRDQPLDMVNASFSKEAFIRLHSSNNKQKSSIIDSLLSGTMLSKGTAPYEYISTKRSNYSNYTKPINMIGTRELKRKYDT